MDRLIHFKKSNSIPALKRLINEAARTISEIVVRRAVLNSTAEFSLAFVTMVRTR